MKVSRIPVSMRRYFGAGVMKVGVIEEGMAEWGVNMGKNTGIEGRGATGFSGSRIGMVVVTVRRGCRVSIITLKINGGPTGMVKSLRGIHGASASSPDSNVRLTKER